MKIFEEKVLEKLNEIIASLQPGEVRLREYIKKPLELEEHNFKINSDGWKKITVDGKKYLENPKKDIWEILEREYRGEQLFTYDAMMRETKKRGKIVPTDNELSELLEIKEDLRNAVLPGRRGTSTAFYGFGSHLNLWSSTPSGSSDAWNRSIDTSDSTVLRYAISRGYGFSVRCLKD